MSTVARAANEGLNLSSKVAVVSGGTQGIGAAVGIRFAQAGASVFVIGRNAELGNAVVEELRRQSAASPFAGNDLPAKQFGFIQADLSLVSGIQDAAAQVIAKTGSGVDFLVQTQGGPPNGKFALTPEGHEQHFAVQCLSRFGLPYLLMQKDHIKGSVVSICAPGGGPDKMIDIEDLDLIKAKADGKYGLLKAGARDSAVVDGFTAEFASRYPSVKFLHLFPGYVQSNAVKNQGFPYPIVLLASIFGPLLARTIGNTPTTYADIPVYLGANEKSKDLGLEYSNERLKKVEQPKWSREEPETRAQLWTKLAANIGA